MAGSESWTWLRVGDLKKETESLITAAQDQALRAHVIKENVEYQSLSALDRMCGKCQGNVEHIVCGYRMLAQRDYKKETRHICPGWSLGTLKIL